ncbi:WhiB family transcriptional regulator [Nocardioides sp. R-C-SC26]|uniref:WhiB family transcriptional regulator n=1 Tax=Nocardioides sp. R-C-SC26 TaxID=2870414 RepID=UPI001E4275CB|nr:WhiB family transcriptional regulator [Nocardioides sp. R-C-SC26]
MTLAAFDEMVDAVVPAWHAVAACRKSDPAAWFPRSSDPNHPQRLRALAVCGECPVRAACLAAAVERREQWGIWGGHDFGRHGAPVSPEAASGP